MIEQNEGPTLETIPQQIIVEKKIYTCSGCKHHEHSILKTGRIPIYINNCLLNQTKGNLDNYFDNYYNIITPNWCPFLNDIKEREKESNSNKIYNQLS